MLHGSVSSLDDKDKPDTLASHWNTSRKLLPAQLGLLPFGYVKMNVSVPVVLATTSVDTVPIVYATGIGRSWDLQAA